MSRYYNLILVFSFLILTNCSDSKKGTTDTSCECADLQLDAAYNHFFLDDRTIGFTGKCEQYNKNGELEFEKHFEKGKLEGKMIIYYPSGKVKSVKTFHKNQQHGLRYDLSESGDTTLKAIYDKGVQDTVFYTN